MSRKKHSKKGRDNHFSHLLNSIKAKVILGFLLFGLAILFSWLVVRSTFNEMIVSIDKISVPNYKMSLINELFEDIAQLEQIQREKSIQLPGISDEELLGSTNDLHRKLDTLFILVHDSESQTARIDSMKSTLDQHKELFKKYLGVKRKMRASGLLDKEVEKMSEIIDNKTPDSSIVKTEKKVTTTTFYPEEAEEERKTFFERLFNGNEKSKLTVPKPDRVVKKEEDILIDTIARIENDTLINQAISLMSRINNDQKFRALQLNKQEYELLNSSGQLIRALMKLSYEIQQEEVAKEKTVTQAATGSILRNLRKFSVFIFAFFILTGLVVFLILLDITRSNYLREELELAKLNAEQHSQVKQRFLANMSHEIRTPLQSIIGFSEQLIKRDTEGNEKPLKAIYGSSRHLLHLVNEVLDYNKLESDSLSLSKEPFSMKDLITEVIEVAQVKSEKSKLRFQHLINIKNRETKYIGDAFRLKQILFNLLDNAIKYTDEGSVFLKVITSEKESASVFYFFVSDTGIGISSADTTRIFNQFEQIAENQPSDGIGLGLRIVKVLVDAHGGKLKLYSEPGVGSTFLVVITYPHAPKTHPQPKPVLSDHQNHRHVTSHVMVIDDDKFARDLYEIIFDKHQISYDLFHSAEDFLNNGLNQVRSGTTLLIDYRLPSGITGVGLTHQIKNTIQEGVLFVGVTAYASRSEIEGILNKHFDDILFKPFTEKQLIDVLNLNRKTSNDCMNTIGKLHPTNGKLNTRILSKLTNNDPVLLQAFLADFSKDSLEDIKSLKKAAAEKDRLKCADKLHRLSGRCGQLGAYKLSVELSNLESLIRDCAMSSLIDDLLEKETDTVIDKLNELIKQLNVTDLKYVDKI